MSSAGIIDFEDVDATVTPPFVARSGALGELKTEVRSLVEWLVLML